MGAAQNRSRRAAWNTRSGLLSGIAICGECKSGMARDSGTYVCSRLVGGCGNISIRAERLEEPIEGVVWFHALRGGPLADSAQIASTSQQQINEIEGKIAAAQAAHVAGDLELTDLTVILKGLRAQRAKLVEEEASAAADSGIFAGIAEYDNADLSLKRTILRRYVPVIEVLRNPVPGRTTFDPNRVRVTTHRGHVLTGDHLMRTAERGRGMREAGRRMA